MGKFDPATYGMANFDPETYGTERPSWLTPGAPKAPRPGDVTGPTDLERELAGARSDARKSLQEGPGSTFTRHAVNAATFGLAGKAVKRIADRKPTGPGPSLADEAEREGDISNPLAAAGGEIVGSIAPVGGPGLLAKGGMKVAGRVLSRLPVTGVVSGIGAGAAKGLLGYELSAPTGAALRAGVEGQNPIEAAREAATSKVGLALAGAGGAVSGGGEGLARKTLDPKTMTGRTAATVRRSGGQINPVGEPVSPVGSNSDYASPSMQSLPHGKEGYNLLAAKGGKAVASHNEAMYRQAKDDFGRAFDAIAQDHPQTLGVEPLHNRLSALQAENTTSNGEVISEQLQAVLDKARKMTTARVMLGDRFEDLPAAKFKDLKKVKTFLQDHAEFDGPATAENRPYRIVYGEVAKAMEDIDPRFAEVNSDFARTIGDLERANDIVFRSADPSVPTGAGKEARAAAFLGRVGDETQAGTTNSLHYDELRRMDPVYANILRQIEAKKAMERLRYGKPEMSMNIEKAALSPFIHNLDAAKLRLGVPAAVAAGGRGAGLGVAGAQLNPILDAYEADRKRNATRAGTVGGR